jgi:hypothetical protein
MEIRQVEPSWHPYGRTEMTKLIVAFRHFANPPKIDRLLHLRFEKHAKGGQRRIGRVQLKCDGTRWRTGGEVKGKLANG